VRLTQVQRIWRARRGSGRDTIDFSVTGQRRVWTLPSDMLSPRYTAEWDELLREAVRPTRLGQLEGWLGAGATSSSHALAA
jgi:Domain of unknown function (DUF4113)